MGERIYTIAEHPVTLDLILREYEIVDFTSLTYYIQPRNVPNLKAQENTTRINKGHMCPGYKPARYYWSKNQAIEMETKRREQAIHHAERVIEDSKAEITVLVNLLNQDD